MVFNPLGIFEKYKGVLFFQITQWIVIPEFSNPIYDALGMREISPANTEDFKSTSEVFGHSSPFITTLLPESHWLFVEWHSNIRIDGNEGIRETKILDKLVKAIMINISGYSTGDRAIDEKINFYQSYEISHNVEFMQSEKLPVLVLNIDVSSLNNHDDGLKKPIINGFEYPPFKIPNLEIKYSIENLSSLKDVQVKHYKIDDLAKLSEDVAKFLRE